MAIGGGSDVLRSASSTRVFGGPASGRGRGPGREADGDSGLHLHVAKLEVAIDKQRSQPLGQALTAHPIEPGARMSSESALSDPSRSVCRTCSFTIRATSRMTQGLDFLNCARILERVDGPFHVDHHGRESAAANLAQLALIVLGEHADDRQAATFIARQTGPQPIGGADLKGAIEACGHVSDVDHRLCRICS